MQLIIILLVKKFITLANVLFINTEPYLVHAINIAKILGFKIKIYDAIGQQKHKNYYGIFS